MVATTIVSGHYKRRIEERIRLVLAEKQLSLLELVRSCQGAFPTIVREVLQEAHSGIARREIINFALASSASGARDTSALVTLEGNPVLSSWYFTDDTCRHIEHMRDWSDSAIAFLGMPRLYEWFAQRKIGKRRALFELDEIVLDRLKELSRTRGDEIVQVDLREEIPKHVLGQFQWVLLDPPWYPDEYEIWIRHGSALAPSGALFMSLFPGLTRPTADAERTAILDYLRGCASALTVLSDWLGYDVPSFERHQLDASGLVDFGPWKLADLVLCQLKPQFRPKGIHTLQRTIKKWTEVDVGSVRIFVADHAAATDGHILLGLLDSATLTLPSPSRRHPGLEKVNVLTSHGAGVICSRPPELMQILEALGYVAKENPIALAQAVDHLAIDSFSRDVLRRLLVFA